MMQYLVVYFSRSGKTAMVAGMIAKLLDADIEEVKCEESYSGPVGWLKGLFSLVGGKKSRLTSSHEQPGKTTVILGMPVWGSNVPPPMRAYIESVDLSSARVCAFCTFDGSGDKRLFRRLEQLVPNLSQHRLGLAKPSQQDTRFQNSLKKWVQQITQQSPPASD